MKFDRAEYINEPVSIEKELKTLFDPDQELTIFEIGACEGEDSIKYSRLFKNSKVFAFEPLPQNIKRIESNIAKYHVENVAVFNIALSSDIGTAEFYVSNGRPENAPETDWDYGNKSSSLLPPDKHTELASFIEFNQKISVETSTIKAFCNSNNIKEIDYIHMDVQGAELLVLQGAGNFISSIKAIWLEVSKIHVYKDQPLANEIDEFMTINGFVLAKDCMEDIQGDRLYISKSHFSDYQSIIKKIDKKDSSLLKRIIKKMKF